MIAPVTKNILIVEDDADIAASMVKALRDIGHTITAVFPTAEEAIDKVKIQPYPDLVIMDVALAGALDGIHAGKYIEDNLNLPVIYITGLANKAALLEEAGKVPLIKPFSAKELKTAIDVIFYIITARELDRKQSNQAPNHPKKLN